MSYFYKAEQKVDAEGKNYENTGRFIVMAPVHWDKDNFDIVKGGVFDTEHEAQATVSYLNGGIDVKSFVDMAGDLILMQQSIKFLMDEVRTLKKEIDDLDGRTG